MYQPGQKKVAAPRVSIGMPVYNGERFIQKAVNSLLEQTMPDFELIISDNASTDRTEAICRAYENQDARIKYIRQSTNLGAGVNFRFVLEEAIGQYFMWAASDDCWSNNWLETLLRDFAAGTALAFGHVVSIDEHNNVIEKFRYRRFSKIPFVCWVQYYMREEMYYKANYIYGLYQREGLLKFAFLETYGADNHFVFEVIQQGRLSTNSEACFFKRFVATSEGASAKEANSGFLRKRLLLDMLPYYLTFPKLARSQGLKVVVIALLPLKYFKSLCFMIYRSVSARLRRDGL